jgi:hypothetical protein
MLGIMSDGTRTDFLHVLFPMTMISCAKLGRWLAGRKRKYQGCECRQGTHACEFPHRMFTGRSDISG